MTRTKKRLECDVIITYCWNRVGYNILKSLSQKGLSVWVADTSKYNICSISTYCSGSFTYPDPFKKEKEFINKLLEKIAELKPSYLLPTHDESIIIAKYKHLFPKDLIIPIDTYQTLISLSDKKIATSIAEKVNVPIPTVYKNPSEISQFPIVCKTRIGNSAKSVFFPKNKEELAQILSKYKEEEILLESFIEGTDHSVDCIRYGKFFYASVYKALITKTEGGGTTTQRIIVDVPILKEYAKRILDEADYKGVCGIDFRYNPQNGTVAFIEVNARYTGGLATPIAAGFNIPWIHYNLATQKSYENPIHLKIGTSTKWILGDVITLVGRCFSCSLSLSELKHLLNFKFDSFDDFDKHDKKAILGEMSYYLCKLIKNQKS